MSPNRSTHRALDTHAVQDNVDTSEASVMTQAKTRRAEEEREQARNEFRQSWWHRATTGIMGTVC